MSKSIYFQTQDNLLARGIKSPETISPGEIEEFLSNLDEALASGLINYTTYNRVISYFKQNRIIGKNGIVLTDEGSIIINWSSEDVSREQLIEMLKDLEKNIYGDIDGDY